VFGRSFRIATIRGIPINVDSSWIWIAVLAVYTLWARFEAQFPGLGDGAAVGYALFGALLFFGSVFLHEAAHAATARLSGIRVDGITLVFFGGFTAARSEERGPGPAFAIAALGPATSLALGGLFWATSKVTEGTIGPLPGLFGYVGFINLFMAIFNVLPGLPLDGGRMLQAAVWRLTRSRAKGTRVAAKAGMGVAVLLFAGAAYEISQQRLFAAIWLGIIGMFIFQGARASEQQVGMAERLAGATVADAMDPPPPAVPADITLSETLDRYLRGHEEETFPVVDDGRVIGVISFASAREIGSVDPLRLAREAAVPLEQVSVVHPDEPLDEATKRLGAGRAALVLRDGALVGSLTGGAVYRWVTSRAR
jgi:Zn-dependent protease/predicted transcriptional regulator